MTDKERKASIAESASNYMRGRAMALSFKPLALGDVKDDPLGEYFDGIR